MIASRQIAFGKAVGKKEEPPAYWGLCFTAEENGSVVAMEAVGTAPAVTLETSYDGEIWEPFYVGETTITLNKGERVYFKAGEGGNAAMASSQTNYNKFSIITGRIAASGNIMSLLNGVMPDLVMSNYGFCSFFLNCTSLVIAPELPATTLALYCYRSMFSGCTSLITAPKLPATTLSQYCYNNMFQGCTSLVIAPELPAIRSVNFCYATMFKDCTSLITAPELPATTVAQYCYQGMFSGCTSLITAPKLPKALQRNAFTSMFYNCKNLNSIEVAFSTFNTQYTSNWVNGVSPTGTFVCPTALGTNETIKRGTSYCPEGWTVINKD
jgi:hypothetical protein